MDGARARAMRDALVVLGACVCVYWAWLGAPGFQGTEGHRVIPGWTMLESGDWLRVSMFEQTYLRKPPGMAWAIGASAAALGESELSARAVSALAATLSAIVALVFARRWFGARWGVWAGLCQALTPLFWQPGRTADIEAVHNLGVQVALFALVDALARPQRERAPGRQIGLGVLGAAGIVIAALAKGPAGAPALAGLAIGLLIAGRSARVFARPALWVALAASAGVLVPLGVVILRANADAGAVREDVTGFLWSWVTLWKTLSLPVVAFVAALPAALWVLFPFGPDARTEARLSEEAATDLEFARVLAWSWLASLGVCVLAGLSNPRYAMPGALLLAPLAAYGVKGAFGGGFVHSRRFIGRTVCLWHPAALPVLLTAAGLLLAARESHWDPDRSGGPDAGRVVGAVVPARSGAIELWADGLVEARPDVLLYAKREAAARGFELRPLWRKGDVQRGVLPPAGSLLALRTDERGDERPAYAPAFAKQQLRELSAGNVHKFTFSVYEVLRLR